ncbi:MAG TPA: hypothetical protein VHN99_07335, partial [Deinococcales bacterium]|nr:hypothetical protein [Deinococcales bacterium]
MAWALRLAVAGQPGIEIRSQEKVVGLCFDDGPRPRVTGLRLASGGALEAGLTLDALGRGTPVPGWLARQGVQVPVESAPSRFVVFARYYAFRPGATFPDGPWVGAPIGRLGYADYRLLPGDNRTFCALFGVPDWDHELRALHHEAAFEAATRAVGPMNEVVAQGDPITPVSAMGQLPNTLRRYAQGGRAVVPGLLAIGDGLAHTDPSFALGLSMALLHARALRDALEAAPSDLDALAAGFHERVMPEAEERYRLTVALNDARARTWRGEPVDFTRAAGHLAAFSMNGTGLVALEDDEVLRAHARRVGFLDRTGVFDGDTGLHARIEGLIQKRLAAGLPPRPGPDRESLLAALREARAAAA